MSLARRDDWVINAVGVAQSNANVYYLTNQSGSTPSTVDLTQLITIYTDATGATTVTNPLTTDGFGHANTGAVNVAGYFQNGTYTIAYVLPGSTSPYLVLNDQIIGGTVISGTVDSVALTAPSDTFGVSGSPITSSGVIALSTVNQTPNTFYAGPATGSAAPQVWRAIQIADLPGGAEAAPLTFLRQDGTWQTVSGSGSVTSVNASVPSWMTVSGGPITASGTLAFGTASATANQVLASPNGTSGVLSVRSLTLGDLPFTGTPSSTTFAAGDGTWKTVSASSVPFSGITTGTSTSGIFTVGTGSTLQIAGPNPWYDVQAWGAAPRAFFDNTSITATISGGSLSTASLSGAADFLANDGIVINFAGAAPATSMQSAPNFTSPVAIAAPSAPMNTGTLTVNYIAIAEDAKGALSPCSAPQTISNAPNGMVNVAFIIASAVQSGTTLTVTTIGNMNASTGQLVMVSYFNAGNPTSAAGFNGLFPITGTPTNTGSPTTGSTVFTVTLPTSASIIGTITAPGAGLQQTARIVTDAYLITAASRSSSTGQITLTLSTTPTVVAKSGLPSIGIISGVATAEANTSYMIGQYPVASVNAGSDQVVLQSAYFAAETAVNLGPNSILTVWNYVQVNLPAVTGNNCNAYYIYADYTNTQNYVLIGKTMPGQQTFLDWGQWIGGGFKAPSYVPTTLTGQNTPSVIPPTTSFTNQIYNGKITAISGTTATISPAASNAVTSQSILHDDGYNISQAIAAAATNTGGAVFLSPGTTSTNDTYHIRFPLTVPGGITIMQGARVKADQTITCHNGCQWVASDGPQFALTPQFAEINYASVSGLASPVFVAGDSCYFKGITFTDNGGGGSNGQTVVYSLGYYCKFELCSFQTFNPATIALNYQGLGGATCSIMNCDFSMSGITGDQANQGQPPSHPTGNPGILLQGDDRTGGCPIFGWTWTGQNSMAGKGITLNTTNGNGPIGDYDINVWEFQAPVMPLWSSYGSCSSVRIKHAVMDSSVINLAANFGVGSTNWTTESITLASTTYTLVTGYAVSGLYNQGNTYPVLQTNNYLADLNTFAHVSNTANNNGQPLTLRGYPEVLQGQGEIFTAAVAPITVGTITASSTGGSLAAGNYVIYVSAQGINGGEFAYSAPQFVTVGGSGSGSINIASWSAVVGAVGYFVSGNVVGGGSLNKQANLLPVADASSGFTWTLNTNFNRMGDAQFPGDGPTFISNISQAIGSPTIYVVQSHFNHKITASTLSANRTASMPDASGTVMVGSAAGVGNGSSTNLTALAQGTGSGPASDVAVGWTKLIISGSTYWVPLFQ